MKICTYPELNMPMEDYLMTDFTYRTSIKEQEIEIVD